MISTSFRRRFDLSQIAQNAFVPAPASLRRKLKTREHKRELPVLLRSQSSDLC